MNERPHTASSNVGIVDEAFYIRSLDRTRRIWIYLPEGYAKKRKRYPVLYMHDGQNLFDEATSFSGEWMVDEIMDRESNPCIVVGIDNGEAKRINEYNPHDSEKFGEGEGRQYLEFIAGTLKPFIDKHYRTLRTRKNTMMAGSSLGGLITFYAGLYYPEIFGRLGVLSPAFWISPGIIREIQALAKPKTHGRQKYFFYGGGLENETLVSDLEKVVAAMHTQSNAKIQLTIWPEGLHNEQTWSRIFPDCYRWLSGARIE